MKKNIVDWVLWKNEIEFSIIEAYNKSEFNNMRLLDAKKTLKMRLLWDFEESDQPEWWESIQLVS